ncbi:DUF4157 domain-containing protein [Micromonospora sp. NPDC048063]|uniref:eCIS core domain-containing protein n=1 Tax=Micromonospora sp. NPDC048063 TaxID=3364256 RepID=UPI003712A68C
MAWSLRPRRLFQPAAEASVPASVPPAGGRSSLAAAPLARVPGPLTASAYPVREWAGAAAPLLTVAPVPAMVTLTPPPVVAGVPSSGPAFSAGAAGATAVLRSAGPVVAPLLTGSTDRRVDASRTLVPVVPAATHGTPLTGNDDLDPGTGLGHQLDPASGSKPDLGPATGPARDGGPAGRDEAATRTAARFAAAGLPIAPVWPPPGFEDVHLAAEATRAAEAARTAGTPGAVRQRGETAPRATDPPPDSEQLGAGSAPADGRVVRPVEVVSRARSARRTPPRPARAGEDTPVTPTPEVRPVGAASAPVDRPAAVPATNTAPHPADDPPPVSPTDPPAHRSDDPTGLSAHSPAAPASPAPHRRDEPVGPAPHRPDRPTAPVTRRVERSGSTAGPDDPSGGGPVAATRGGAAVRPAGDQAALSPARFLTRRTDASSVGTGERPAPVPPVTTGVPASVVRTELPAQPPGPPPVGGAVSVTGPDPATPEQDRGDAPLVSRPVPTSGAVPGDAGEPIAGAPQLPAPPGVAGYADPRPTGTEPTSGVSTPGTPTPPPWRPASPTGPAIGTPVVADPWPVPAPGTGPAPATDDRIASGTAVPSTAGGPFRRSSPVAGIDGAPATPERRSRNDLTGDAPPDNAPPARPGHPPAMPLRYPDPPSRVLPAAPAEGPTGEPVPAVLVDGIRRRYGVDVSDVPVRRGPEATAEVRQAGARAATRDGEVLLPADAGPLDAPPARALLAHELAHVVQQRVLGGTAPAESTAAGRDLEARALAAEYAFGDGSTPNGVGPLAPAVPLVAVPAGPASTSAGGTWGATPDGGLTWRAGPVGPAPTGHPVQRAPVGGSADALADLRDPVRAEVNRQEGAEQAGSSEPMPETTLAALRAEVAAATAPPAFDRSAGRLAEVRDAVERLREELRTATEREEATTARLDRDTAFLRSWLGDRLPGRTVDLDDADDLEELAGRLYGRLRGRLRQELLVDRERGGRLARFP